MARPAKDPRKRLDFDLRIPVTKEQRQVIDRAVALTRDGQFAAWARKVLLLAAEAAIADEERNKTS